MKKRATGWFKRNGPGAGSCFNNGRRFRNWDGLETEERRPNEPLYFGELFLKG